MSIRTAQCRHPGKARNHEDTGHHTGDQIPFDKHPTHDLTDRVLLTEHIRVLWPEQEMGPTGSLCWHSRDSTLIISRRLVVHFPSLASSVRTLSPWAD